MKTPSKRNKKTAAPSRPKKAADRRRLEDRAATLAVMLDLTPAAIIVHDAEGRILYANRHASKIHGYSHREFLPLTLLDTVAQDDGNGFAARIRHILAVGHASFDVTHRKKDGSILPLHIDVRTTRWEGKPALLSVQTDLTERRQAEAEIRTMNERLEERIQERTRNLAEINRELELFIDSISHDLGGPMQIMGGFSKALLDDYSDRIDEAGREYLQYLNEGTLKLRDMVAGLLALSRTGRTAMQRSPVDLATLARDLINDLQRNEPDRIVVVSVAGGLEVMGDERLLRSLLMNLLGNAWKFTGRTACPRIEVGVQRDAEEPVFHVRDNGVGFDMAQADKLFAPFKRLASAHDFEGTGMGLTTVRRIVGRHGGRIWAESEPGKGATFYFTLGQSMSDVSDKSDLSDKGAHP